MKRRLKMRERRSLRRYYETFGGTMQTSVLAFRFVSFILPLVAFLGIGAWAQAHSAAFSHVLSHSLSAKSLCHPTTVLAGFAAAAPALGNINALRQKKIDLKAEADKIIADALKAGTFTPEQRTKLGEMKAAMQTLANDLAIVEAFLGEECRADAPKADDRGVPRTIGNKKVYARLSDQILANGMKPTQKSESLPPFSSLADQLKAVYNSEKRGAAIDPRLVEIQAALGANESVPAEGGFLVVPEFAEELIKRTYDVGMLTQRCYELPMQSARLILKAVDEDSRKDGSRWGGVLAFWLAEAGTYQPSKPKFREMQLVANKLIALSYATEEELNDAPAWNKYVNDAVPQELSFQIDTAIFSGGGAGQPLGFSTSQALLTQAKEAGQAAATVVTNNILKMHKQLFARSRKTAAWFINQEIEDQLYTLALQNPTGAVLFTNPLYTPPGVNGNAGPYGLLLGKPVIPIEQCSALGTLGDIVLADMQQYILAKHTDVRADTSIHVAFLTGEQAFRWMLRLDGQPMWKKPLTPYKGSTGFQVSPFIALATRS